MENNNNKSVKVAGRVAKVFRSAKVGDRVAYLTYAEEGGIFRVTGRSGVRGVGGTITLSLERDLNGQLLATDLDMRRDGAQIATMSLLRDRKPRGRRKKSVAVATPVEGVVESPAAEEMPAADEAPAVPQE